jgi:hypothetical protein
MKLSMWNIADYLKKKGLSITTFIKNGAPVLTCARLLTPDKKEPHALYVFDCEIDSSDNPCVLISNGMDIIRVTNSEPETVMNEVTEAFDLFNLWEYNLSDKAINKCGLQEMIDLTDPILRNPIYMHSPVGQVLGMSKKYGPELNVLWAEMLESGWLPKFRLEQLVKYDNLSRIYLNTTPNIYYSKIYKCRYIHCAIIIKDKSAIHVLVDELDNAFDDGILPIVQTFINAVTRHIKVFPEFYQPRVQLSTIICSILDGENVPRFVLQTALPHVNWSESDTYAVSILSETTYGELVMINRICSTLSDKILSSFCFQYKSNVAVLVTNLTKSTITSVQLSGEIEKFIGGGFVCCVSMPFQGISKMYDYYTQTMAALKYALLDNRTICHAQEYALRIMTEQLQSISWLDSLVCPAIYMLLQYDRENNSNFFETLRAYLRCGGVISITAKTLNVHRNTLIYRLERIKELVGTDIDNPDVREYLILSYLMIRQ